MVPGLRPGWGSCLGATVVCQAAWEAASSLFAFFGDRSRFYVLGKDTVENMLFITVSEADEQKGQARGSKAETLAPISSAGAAASRIDFPKNSTLRDSRHGNERLGEPDSISSIGFLLSFPFHLPPLQVHLSCFPSPRCPASRPHLQPWTLLHPAPDCPGDRQTRGAPSPSLLLHIKGRSRHLLSMKCGSWYILWKQKRKNHRGPSCKNNHYPLK